MAITLTDIARRAACSEATVSRALNGTACVNRATRARILKAASELGDPFVASAGGGGHFGRPRGSLRKSDTIDIVLFQPEPIEPLMPSDGGLTVTSMTDVASDVFFAPRLRLSTDFYRHMIDGATAVLAEQQLKAVQQVRRDLLDEGFLRDLNQARHRGVLLLGAPGAAVQSFVRHCERPLVLADILGVSGPPTVMIDNVGGIGDVMRHLLKHGHRAIGFAGDCSNPSYTERYMGFCAHLAQADLPLRKPWVYNGPSHIANVVQGMRVILARGQRPTAVVCCNDYMAMGVIQAAQAARLVVPRDLSVTGFDDVDVAPLVRPPLTTVHVPTRALGAQAVRMLLSEGHAWKPQSPWGYEVRVKTNLVVRGSTAVPNNGKRR